MKKEISETYSENPLEKWSKDKIKANIELINSDTIIRVKPMKYSVEDQKEFKDQIKELLEAKLIRPSKSPHSSPAFMVRKHSEIKRRKARMVINYKKLNEVTKFDGYYLPNKDTLIKQIQNKKIFSKFDCKSGFWQIILTEQSKPLTAFSTPNPLGQYEWNVMPFGLKNAPQIFQRRMDEVIKPITDFCIDYVDDILIHSNNMNEHIEHLEKFCYIMKKHGITLSQKKAEIAKTEIEFLGLFIKKGELQLQSHIGEKFQEFPEEIKDKKQLQSFLGILNYAEGFIEDCAKLKNYFLPKLKKDMIWSWEKQDCENIRKVKEELKILPKLIIPNEDDFFILETDASDNYWGAVLKVKKNHKEYKCEKNCSCIEKLAGYTSGTFKEVEKRYESNRKELIAVKRGVQKYEDYLLPKKFLIRTDNTQVKAFLKNNIDPSIANRYIIRIQIWFSYFKFDIEYIKGKTNFLPDYLSRDGAGTTKDESSDT